MANCSLSAFAADAEFAGAEEATASAPNARSKELKPSSRYSAARAFTSGARSSSACRSSSSGTSVAIVASCLDIITCSRCCCSASRYLLLETSAAWSSAFSTLPYFWISSVAPFSPMPFAEFSNVGNLHRQIIRHRRALRFVLLKKLVAKRRALGVEDDAQVVRFVVLDDPAKNV